MKRFLVLMLLCLGLRIGGLFGAEETKEVESVLSNSTLVAPDLEDSFKVWFLADKELNPDKDTFLYLPKSFLERFQVLKPLLDFDYGDVEKELHLPDSVVSYEDLNDLYEMITFKIDFINLEFIRLSRLVSLAYELGSDQETKQLLSPILDRLRNQFKVVANQGLAALIKNDNGDIKLPLIQDIKSNKFLEGVIYIVYSPDGSCYWVIDCHHRAQRYNAAGVAQGESLVRAIGIVYSPDGSSYWVIDLDRRAQRYNAAGVAQGEPLLRVENIVYSSDAGNYCVIYKNCTAQRYNAAGVAQGEPLLSVENIVYSSDGGSYCVIYKNRTAQRYNAAGVAQGEPLLSVENIVYSPDGSSYWVIDWLGHRAQRYNAAGVAQGEPLEGVRNIVYSPDGSSYCVIHNFSMNRRAQRYNAEGVAHGEPLVRVENIVYSPDGSSYFVIGDDRRAYHTFKFSGLPLYQQVMIQWVVNKFESNDKKAINLDTEQLAILNSKSINDLAVAGYINQPGVSGGGASSGVGVGAGSA